MTVVVGIRCTDGVVIGTDSAMTFGPSAQQMTIEQPYHSKIDVIDSRIIVAGTGQIGLGQRFAYEVEKLWRGKSLSGKNVAEVGNLIAKNTINNFSSTNAKTGQYGALAAVPCRKKAELIEFDLAGFQPEFKTDDNWYASMGSGQMVADPLLGFVRRVFWGDSRRKGKMEYSQQRWCLNWLAIWFRLALHIPSKWPSSHRMIRANWLQANSLQMNCMSMKRMSKKR